MNEKLNQAQMLFYSKDYSSAKDIFIELNETYGAGLCCLLMKDLTNARKYFELKENDCTASDFGLAVVDIIENKRKRPVKFFQVRSFLEIYINLLIENNLLEWAQKIINNYPYFTNINIEVPKFIARVLNANNYNRTVHFFAQTAKNICQFDAEIYYIEATLYIQEKNIEEAKKTIDACLKFAPEYYPMKKLKQTVSSI